MAMLAETGDGLSGVVNLAVPEAMLVERMAGRVDGGEAVRRPAGDRPRAAARLSREDRAPGGFLPEARPDRRRRRRRCGARGLQPNRRGAPERTSRVPGARHDHDPQPGGAPEARGGLAHRPRDPRPGREGGRSRRHDRRARPDRRGRDPPAGRPAGLRRLPRLPEDAVHLDQRRGRARDPGRRVAAGGRRHRRRLRRRRGRLLRRRGADDRGGQDRPPRRRSSSRRRAGRSRRASPRPVPAAASRTSARRSRRWPWSTATASCATSSGTAWARPSTRSPRSPTTARRGGGAC